MVVGCGFVVEGVVVLIEVDVDFVGFVYVYVWLYDLQLWLVGEGYCDGIVVDVWCVILFGGLVCVEFEVCVGGVFEVEFDCDVWWVLLLQVGDGVMVVLCVVWVFFVC